MTNIKQYLESVGRSYPEPDMPDGSISGEAFEKAGLPMVIACSHCSMTMVCTPERPCLEDGAVLCEECAGFARKEWKL